MKNRVLCLLAILCLLFSPAAFSGENVWDMAESDQYGKKAPAMVGRGVINAATCFVDILVQTVEGTQDGPPFLGTLTGLGGGIGCAALRVTSGVLDVLTFWVPGFNGFKVSRSYSDCLAYTKEPVYTEPAPAMVVPQQMEQPKPVTYVQEPKQEPAPNPMDYVKKGEPEQLDPMEYVKK